MHDTLLEIARDADVCIVTVKSEIDIANAETVSRYVAEAASGSSALILSLAACPFIDSSGIGPLVKFAARFGRGFCVIAPKGSRARRVFDIIDLHERVPIRESLADALAHLERPIPA